MPVINPEMLHDRLTTSEGFEAPHSGAEVQGQSDSRAFEDGQRRETPVKPELLRQAEIVADDGRGQDAVQHRTRFHPD